MPTKYYCQVWLLIGTIGQAINVSTLPGVRKHVVILPDGHEGYGFPVGGVAAMDLEGGGVISPGGVGYDINCGVRLIRTNLTEKDVKPKKIELINELFTSIPSGLGSQGQIKLTRSELDEVLVEGVRWSIAKGYGWSQDEEVCEENGCIKFADPIKVSDTAKKRGVSQLGSLGSGNHFLEVQKVDTIYDREAAKTMGITNEGQVTVLIHCGSRGFGHQVCSDYLRVSEAALRRYDIKLRDRELACVPYNSQEGEDYVRAMNCALNFAWSNRQMIMHWTRKTFQKVFAMSEDQIDMKLVYDVAHNIAKVERHKVQDESCASEKSGSSNSINNNKNNNNVIRSLIVHRKGATRAFPAGMEQVPIKYRNIRPTSNNTRLDGNSKLATFRWPKVYGS